MNEMIASCGCNCLVCPAYLATRENDDGKRKEIAERWSKLFEKILPRKLSVKDINCDGCLNDGGRLFMHCQNCEVRKCAQERSLENCAYCSDYLCEKLDRLLKSFPVEEPRNTLERIRASRG